jgi:hypothetical protein
MVTRYAVDIERQMLIGTHATGAGDLAFTVAALPARTAQDAALRVAARLDSLARALWRCYTHPPESAGDDLSDNTEGWRRQLDRDEFGQVVAIVANPNLPDENGSLVVDYSPVTESAHRLGRALHGIGDEAFTAAVLTDVAAEIDAIERAELGDLSGRAAQAVQLSRTSASPAQVAAADALLRSEPLGGIELFTAVDPTSAAVAAAHWLHAAATVTAQASGYDITQIVEIADDIEAIPTASPTLVLEMMEAGASPNDAVTALISEAIAIAEGQLPNLPGLMAAVSEAVESAERLDDEDLLERLVAEIRTTPLDTSRPAIDLLEDLLTGIYACALLYQEYESDIQDDETAEAFEADLAEVEDVVAAITTTGDSPTDDKMFDHEDDDQEWPDVASPRFLDAVRARASADASRL